jgi:hypothetical protein
MEFREFGSLDEMFEFMKANEDAANASLTPQQRSLDWGSYWVSPQEDFVIFGYCYTYEQQAMSERYAYHHGGELNEEEEAEFEYTMRRSRENHEAGRMFGTAFSVIEPTGELGTTHKAAAWPISADQFVSALLTGWVHTHPLVRSWLEPLLNQARASGEGVRDDGTTDRG